MTKLFVVGFPKEMSEIDLDQLFTLHALVRKITVIRDMQTGESKGYAFADMMDAPGAARCIEALDGMTFGNRVMSVRMAEQKAPEKRQAINRPAKFPGKPTTNSFNPNTHSRPGTQRPRIPKND